MPGGRVIEALAHAKVNLALAVGAPLPAGGPHAGLHPVCSWMHALELGDHVRVERLGDGARSSFAGAWDDGSPLAWGPADDLASRAHRAIEARAGRPLPAAVRVTKRTPAGGGLGGGSGDAAAVLLALDELFGLELGERALREVALGLGSDVPFFVDAAAWAERRAPRPAIVSGVGERVERLDRRAGDLVLVCPPFGCATGAVYRAFDDAPGAGLDGARVRRAAGGPVGGGFNDLAEPAGRVEPRLRDLLTALAPTGRWAVSGSGSTVYAFGADAGEAERAAPGCRVVRTRLA